MKWRLFMIPLALASVAMADTMTLRDGTTVRGSFQGFAGRQFQFRTEDGAAQSEYAADVQDIALDAPMRVSVLTALKQHDSAVLGKIDHNFLRLRKEGAFVNEPLILLKRLDILGPVNAPPAASSAVDAAGLPRAVANARPPAERDWKRSGKWREIEDDKSIVISHGEVVDIEASLKKGLVNVVHFHYPQAMSSTRQGSYVQGLMARHPNRVVVMKVVAPDFNAPICSALSLKSLPQFWFYSPDGRLVKKLTDRFTESDIDAALRDAGRN